MLHTYTKTQAHTHSSFEEKRRTVFIRTFPFPSAYGLSWSFFPLSFFLYTFHPSPKLHYTVMRSSTLYKRSE